MQKAALYRRFLLQTSVLIIAYWRQLCKALVYAALALRAALWPVGLFCCAALCWAAAASPGNHASRETGRFAFGMPMPPLRCHRPPVPGLREKESQARRQLQTHVRKKQRKPQENDEKQWTATLFVDFKSQSTLQKTNGESTIVAPRGGLSNVL